MPHQGFSQMSPGKVGNLRFQRGFLARGAVVLGLLTCLSTTSAGPSLHSGQGTRGGVPGWSLTWSDEFEGDAINSSKWSFDIGGKGWGNNELETYTSRNANAHLESGQLVITALKETFTGPDKITRNYTSARLLTKKKFSQLYGRFEARIKIPYGQGIWPAFWMLGDNIDAVHWPNCGEIDIMENIGREPSIVHGTFHGPGYSGEKGVGAAFSLPPGRKFADDFHTFAVEWGPNVIRFYVDDSLYQSRTPADLPPGTTWVFDYPFFIILNVAVGGGWPGNPDATTTFPQHMLVDYVRVYKRSPQS
jgi:beta-glucanase (GH16 family)